MSVAIRLSKTGKKGEAKFRVIVKEKRSRRDGKAIETLGWFIKREKNAVFHKINKERANYWISKGAIATQAVKKILDL